MPRQTRKKSNSGIYHVMFRGINKQRIFEEKEDYDKFLQICQDNKAVSGYKIFAYCLMSNHIHILIKEENEPIDQVFKRIVCRFVYWYNVKYQRSGHLFQDRFKSEPVEDEAYLFTVIRYIHQNPIKAGICKKLENYEYSSYKEYLYKPYLTDIDFIYEIINKTDFIDFNNSSSTEKCLDIEDSETKIRMTDEQAKEIIEKYTKCKNLSDYQDLNCEQKEKTVVLFYNKGMSIRQISRLTGVSKGQIEKYLK